MHTAFLLQHLHVQPESEENIKVIGIYSSRHTALEAVNRLRTQPGFCRYPNLIDPLTTDEVNGFYIDAYTVDQDHWEDGFIKV